MCFCFSLTYLYECGVIEGSSPTVTHKVLPSLVRLTRKDVQVTSVRTEAITALGRSSLLVGEFASDRSVLC